ncbi:MAG: quinone-dependent dihydroorotate dehydrogenase [Bacteroidia bacterium]|nr:quinone-dependent dihydroorotate dehydrogenase [Bacteroidia bacterium]
MYSLIKKSLFLMQPEKAHYFTMSLLKTGLKIPIVSGIIKSLGKGKNTNESIQAFGLTFPNVIGLAAGFDKNAMFLEELSALGFGHIEIGTVTPKPQDGNEKPRLFRLVKDNALINRMGFNNDGVEVVAERLKKRPAGLIVGGNIGKNKVTPNENALDDYVICFKALYNVVDYFTVNVSSPNTPGLRDLQEKEPLTHLLKSLIALRGEIVASGESSIVRPVLLKIAPDLTDSQLDDIAALAVEAGIDGLIATNTTISRAELNTSTEDLEKIGAGGLSGEPVEDKSTYVIQYLSKKLNGAMPIIGVGGIHDVKGAKDKLDAGATLLQLYTGFIFKGPALIGKIKNL